MVVAADIQTSAQAAEALRPIAGIFTFALFAAGIIGISFLAVPFFRRRGQIPRNIIPETTAHVPCYWMYVLHVHNTWVDSEAFDVATENPFNDGKISKCRSGASHDNPSDYPCAIFGSWRWLLWISSALVTMKRHDQVKY
jgi:hypothetical protein